MDKKNGFSAVLKELKSQRRANSFLFEGNWGVLFAKYFSFLIGQIEYKRLNLFNFKFEVEQQSFDLWCLAFLFIAFEQEIQLRGREDFCCFGKTLTDKIVWVICYFQNFLCKFFYSPKNFSIILKIISCSISIGSIFNRFLYEIYSKIFLRIRTFTRKNLFIFF